MKSIRVRASFKKDLKRITKRGYELALIEVVIDLLRRDLPLPAVRRDHSLKGEWKGWRECHIEPDWLLIYRATGAGDLLLARTGTHPDLFET